MGFMCYGNTIGLELIRDYYAVSYRDDSINVR